MGEAVARAQRGALSGRGRTSALRSMRHPGEAVGGRGIGEGEVGGPEKRTLLAHQGVPGCQAMQSAVLGVCREEAGQGRFTFLPSPFPCFNAALRSHALIAWEA